MLLCSGGGGDQQAAAGPTDRPTDRTAAGLRRRRQTNRGLGASEQGKGGGTPTDRQRATGGLADSGGGTT